MRFSNLLLKLLASKPKQNFPSLLDDEDTAAVAHVSIADLSEEFERDLQTEILLAEYKEIVDTLRNWDRIVYQTLSVVGTVVAAIVTFSQQNNGIINWGMIFSLIMGWAGFYIYQAMLAEVRINVLVKIEERLEMVGQYREMRQTKNRRNFTIWFIIPFAGAFVIGPIFGYVIGNPGETWSFLLVLFGMFGKFIQNLYSWIVYYLSGI